METFHFENGKFTSSRVFKELFYGHTILRPSCYECPYKSVMHPGDITIADYWGIEKAAPEFDDNKGVSLVLVNNEAGERDFEKVKEIFVDSLSCDESQVTMEANLKDEIYRYAGERAFCKECNSEVFVSNINDYNLKNLYSLNMASYIHT